MIATGFKTSPLTGVDKAPEKVVLPLEPEAKKEITQPLQNPTEQNQVQNTLTSSTTEPYIKAEQQVVNNQTTAFTQPEVKPLVVDEPKFVEPIKEVKNPELVWEIESNTVQNPVQQEIKTSNEPEKIVHQLDSDDVYNLEQASSRTAKIAPSQDEQIRLNAERMQRIQEYTQKLKKADGLSELEKEPAFVRRKIQLDNSKPSIENNNSRFGVSGNGDNNLRSNNSFLHDNVD